MRDRVGAEPSDGDVGIDSFSSAGKRTLTQRLAVQRGPAPPVVVQAATAPIARGGDDPFAMHLLGGTPRTPETSESVHRAAELGTSGPSSSLPHASAIQRSFGRHDIGDIQAHTGTEAAAGSRAMNAEAFASGNHVAFAGAPGLHTAAHEAAHVVQQRGGVQLKGGVGEEGDTYERHADAVADAVVAGRSAEALLDVYAGGPGAGAARATQRAVVQRAPMVPAPNTANDTVDANGWTRPQWLAWYQVFLDVTVRHSPNHGTEQRWRDAATRGDVGNEIQPIRNDPHTTLNMAAQESDQQKRRPGSQEQALAAIALFRAEGEQHGRFRIKRLRGQTDAIADRLTELVHMPHVLSQGKYNTCGANTLLHSMLVIDPLQFVQYVIGLVTEGRGQIGDHGQQRVKLGKRFRKKRFDRKQQEEKSEAVDLLAIGGLRNSKNKAMQNITSKGLGSMIEGVSTVSAVRAWYRKCGYTIVDEKHLAITQRGKGPRPDQFLGLADQFQTREVALYVNAGRMGEVVQNDDQGNIIDQHPNDGSGSGSTGDHFVRLASTIIDDGTTVHFQVWNWGKIERQSLSYARLPKVVIGYVVAEPPDPGMNLAPVDGGGQAPDDGGGNDAPQNVGDAPPEVGGGGGDAPPDLGGGGGDAPPDLGGGGDAPPDLGGGGGGGPPDGGEPPVVNELF